MQNLKGTGDSTMGSISIALPLGSVGLNQYIFTLGPALDTPYSRLIPARILCFVLWALMPKDLGFYSWVNGHANPFYPPTSSSWHFCEPGFWSCAHLLFSFFILVLYQWA